MAAYCELLEELPAACLSPCGPPNPAELFSEARRLALEQLLAGGPNAWAAFLRRERLGRFLNADEVRAVLSAAERPGEDGAAVAEDSFGSSHDCSSGTYFPEQSDLEPPALELGWPAFYRGAYRGVTRVEAHFQPRGAGAGGPYGCKDALRQQLRSAREVIAVVMDVFSDIDIFRDLQEICRNRGVAVYILLDQALLSHFLDMCMDLKVHPEQEKLMTVRTITGNIYYARSGTKVVGKVHEKFTLIDGIRVATGSYSFTWTDGKLNSSNLVILSGQVVEHFDLEFRILYAQSKPISSKLLSNFQISGKFDHLADRKPHSKEPTLGNLLRIRLARLSSTPKNNLGPQVPPEDRAKTRRHDSEASTISDEDYFYSHKDQLEDSKVVDAATQTEPGEEMVAVSLSEVGTQTSSSVACVGIQTTVVTRAASSQATVWSKSTTTQTEVDESFLPQGAQSKEGSPASRMSVSRSSSLRSSSSMSSQGSLASSVSSHVSLTAPDLRTPRYPNYLGLGTPHLDLCLRDSFRNLSKERQVHFTGIRSRLNQMLTVLSRRTLFSGHYLSYSPGAFTRASVNLVSVRDIALHPPCQ
ncbi:protein FAM83D [Onychomys torridus]|uniref:protein FAM83D n=1 Tax=Onychomys torridus TaxID=38674 RepID=UPI00167F7E1F|nr:protein FAM83D [Onychomys torridus]